MKKILLITAVLLAALSCKSNTSSNPVQDNPAEYQSSNPENMQSVCDFLHPWST